MAKTKIRFFCKECGYESAKWLGNCPSCKSWNTFTEEPKGPAKTNAPTWDGNGTDSHKTKPVRLADISTDAEVRICTPDNELNRILGGGIVSGSLILVGGEPGIGKSTLLLQLALSLGELKSLYVSGEESGSQIKMRAQRLKISSDNTFFLTQTRTAEIFRHIRDLSPDLVIVDSIQTMYSDNQESGAGSVSQVRHCAGEFMQFAKETGTPVFLIGHITKDGSIAGPKVLEHMVDTVLQFEGERRMSYRILRTTKNRFGSTDELGIYEMLESGLRQVENPSEVLISANSSHLSGVAIGATMEGNRPLLIEVQALVSPATFGTPQRTTTGFEHKRLNMLLAVLEKRGGFRMGMTDVFINMAGGIKVEDPAIDLAVCAAIVSSLEDKPIPEKVTFASEVGLGGELRSVSRLPSRISEAEKLGFEKIFISSQAGKNVKRQSGGIRILQADKLSEVFSALF